MTGFNIELQVFIDPHFCQALKGLTPNKGYILKIHNDVQCLTLAKEVIKGHYTKI